MKVAIYTHCYFPTHVYGTEVYVAVLARELMALGHDPVVISAVFEGEPRQSELVERYTWDGVPVISIDKNGMPEQRFRDTYDQPSMRVVHEQILRELKPDVVHVCHLINHTTAALEAASLLDIPIVATLTDFFGVCLNHRLETASGALCQGPNAARSNCMACHLKGEGERPDAGPRWRYANAPTMRPVMSHLLAAGGRYLPGLKIGPMRPADIVERPDRLRRAFSSYRAAIAPSSFLRDVYEANGFPAPLDVVHFGLDIDRAPKPRSIEPARVRLVFMGQIAPHKGLHIVLKAMRAAAAPNVHLTVWGDTGQNPAYLAELHKLADGLPVRFAGRFPRDQVARVLAEADAAVIPSLWYENSPQSLLEALSTHTPAIVSDMPGLTEFVRDGENGFIVRTGEISALAKLLTALAADPSRLAAMSQVTVYSRTPREMVEETLAFYPGLKSP